MAQEKIMIQNIADQFLHTPIEVDNTFITPVDDLLLNLNENALYYYKTGAWHYFDVGNRNTGRLAKLLDTFIRDHFPTINITNNKLLEIKDSMLRRLKNVYEDVFFPPFITFKDITVDLKTLTTIPHNRNNYSFIYMDFPSTSLQDPCPTFDNYLKTTFHDCSEELLRYVLEMLGFYLMPTTGEPAVFFLYGEQRTGKSTMMKLLQEMIGHHFTCSFSLQSITTKPTIIAALTGKRVNIFDEDESDYVKADKLKALTSYARMEAKRLYEQEYTVIPTTKYIFSSNQFPKLTNVDGGVMRRLHFIEFPNQLKPEQQDKDIDKKLKAEIPGIVGQCLLALQSFLSRNQEFIIPEESKKTTEQFLLEAVPVKRFFDERCELASSESMDMTISNKALYQSYTIWCEGNGHKAVNSNNFGKQIIAIKGVEERRRSDVRGKNIILKSVELCNI